MQDTRHQKKGEDTGEGKIQRGSFRRHVVLQDCLGNTIASSFLPHGVNRPTEGKWRLEVPNLYGTRSRHGQNVGQFACLLRTFRQFRIVDLPKTWISSRDTRRTEGTGKELNIVSKQNSDECSCKSANIMV